VHDAQFGDGNNSRRRPVHGWIVQNVLAGKVVVLGDTATAPGQPTATQPDDRAITGGPAAWGRPLAQGRGSLVPFLQDYSPVLNAGPF
jgi:hypothetical protein